MGGYFNSSKDKKAILDDWITEYEKDVWNFAFSLVHRQDLADDITQDVFVKAFKKVHTFRGESSVKTWLFTITRNVAIDYRRSAFFRKVNVVETIAFTGFYQSAENEFLDHFVIENVWKVVLRLPLKLRQVMVLSAHHQLSYSEIADVLGISESLVKTRLHRARKNALKMLKEEGEQDEKD